MNGTSQFFLPLEIVAVADAESFQLSRPFIRLGVDRLNNNYCGVRYPSTWAGRGKNIFVIVQSGNSSELSDEKFIIDLSGITQEYLIELE